MIYDIQNNTAALNAERSLGVSSSAMNQSLERLSSGFRINGPADDAAGLAISQGLTGNIASANVAQQNISQATSLLQVADGAMSSVGDILTRMQELATEASSAQVGTDITPISNEYDQLVNEVNMIANSTQYAGQDLVNGTGTAASNTTTSFNTISNVYNVNVSSAAAGTYTVTYSATGSPTGGAELIMSQADGSSEAVALTAGAQTIDFSAFGISFQTTAAATTNGTGEAIAAAFAGGADLLSVTAGAGNAGFQFQIGYADDVNSQLSVNIDSITAAALGLATGQLSSATTAEGTITTLNNAVSTLADSRGSLGAYENRLSYANENLTNTIQNLTSANSSIKDVDMAAEMTNFTKQQILVQAGTAMLAQANQAPQQVLALFK